MLSEHAPALAKSLGATAIAVRGTSGYSVAFAMRMLTDFPIIVARKPGEASHGSPLSIVDDGTGNSISRYLILDDIVDTGATVRKLMEDLYPAKCVGVLEYYELMMALQLDKKPSSTPDPRSLSVQGVNRYYYDC